MPHPKIARVIRGPRIGLGIDTPESRSSAIDFMERMGERIRREGFTCALDSAKADLRKPRLVRLKRPYIWKTKFKNQKPKCKPAGIVNRRRKKSKTCKRPKRINNKKRK